MKKITTALMLLIGLCATSSGQLYEVPLSQRVANSNLIVEGQVLSHYSLWDNNNANIYTVNKVLISKVFKGTYTDSVVNIITYGGTVGLTMERVSNTLKLRDGDMALFNLTQSSLSLSVTGGFYEVYADAQGCLAYDKFNYSASGPFESYGNVENVLYPAITQHTATIPTVKRTINWKIKATPASGSQFAFKAVTSFTPTTATAGTATTITINGTGFGATQGSGIVQFSDADDGGASFIPCLASQIVSWSNTQIVVEVPSHAGTGPIQVVDNGSGTHTSAASLTIPYSELNVESDAISSGTFIAYPTQHVDDNGSGGLTWQYFTDFAANASAVASFERAINSLIDTTCINWVIGSNTTVDIIDNDNVNVVRFDNGSELSPGVLGRCTSRYSGCFINGGTSLDWYVTELDIVFDDGTNWEFGPALPSASEYDFESVAVHELGHGHQLGHVINTNLVMHYALSNGETNRDLGNDEITAALNIMTRSTTNAVCSQSLMTEHSSCAVCTDPTVPSLSLDNTAICNGGSTNLNITGTLNDATTWEVYTVSCGGTTEASTSGSSVSVSPTATTTYFVRGEGGCVTPGSCSSIILTVNELPNVSATSSTGETCAGNDGTATVTPSGGGGGYVYTWDAGTGNQTTQTATGLSIGTYGVTVTDANTCANSTTVTVNDDCTVPNTNLKGIYCGTTPTVNDYLLVVPVTGATNYEYEITNQTSGHIDTFYRGAGISTFRTQWIPTFDFGTTFSIRVRAHIGSSVGSYGVACLVSTPGIATVQLKGGSCGLVASSMSDFIFSQGLVGSEDFRYQFSDQGGPDVITHDRGANNSGLRLSWVNGLKYGTTYDVQVAVQVNGSFGGFGPVCTVTTPAFPSTQLKGSSCNTVLSSLGQNLFAVPVPSAIGYQYEWAPQGGGTTLTYTKNSSQTSMKPSNVTGIQLGVVYDVRVRAIVAGDTGSYGPVCTVSTVGASAIPTQEQIAAWEAEEQNELSNITVDHITPDPEVLLSPNPNNGTFLKIDYVGEIPMYNVEVFDLTGKRVLHNGYTGQYSNTTMLTFDRTLSNGLYLVKIVFEDNTVITKKLLVKH